MGKYSLSDYKKRKKRRIQKRNERRSHKNDKGVKLTSLTTKCKLYNERLQGTDLQSNDQSHEENTRENDINIQIIQAANEIETNTQTENELQRDTSNRAHRKRHNPANEHNHTINKSHDLSQEPRPNKRRHKNIDSCANTFYKKTKEGPIYCCVSCKRLLFRNSVVVFKPIKYNEDVTNIISELCNQNKDLAVHETPWICFTCHRALKRSKRPTQCVLNELSLDSIPDELLDLRPLEQRLISQRIVFMKLVALPKGGQKSIHGPAINVPTELKDVCTVLPRIPDNAHVVSFKLKRKLVYKGHYMHEYIRPLRVIKALRWLKQNNELYRDIQICEDWEQEWENADNEFWRAVTSQELVTDSNNDVCNESGSETNIGLDNTTANGNNTVQNMVSK